MDEARQVTVVRGRRPGGQWVSVGHGLHHDGGVSLVSDLLAWQSVLRPAAAFTGLTSAQLRGWWLPPLPQDLPVFVATVIGQNASTRRGLVVTRHKGIPPSELIEGVRVATVAETLVACAAVLELLDLVVLVDCVLHLGRATREELTEAARARRRGAPRLRRALGLADERSESAWETLLRILHVVCDIEVEPQHEVFDADGTFVARGDLWLVGTSTFHEYDGGDHLERRRQRKDLKRARRLGNADLERRGYTAQDVLAQAVTILRDADLTLGRPHDPGRIRAWHQLLRSSLFTPAGTAVFRRRLGLNEKTADTGT